MSAPRIFVSGIAGFLGSHVAEEMRDLGYDVIGCDSLIGGDLANVPDGVVFRRVDIRDRAALAPLLRGCEVVYHTAALAYEGLSVFSPAQIGENVYGGTVSLLSAAIAAGVRRFVFCSSMARYGAQGVPFVETMAPAPVDPYGIAKVAAEATIASLAATHGMEYVILVPHNIVGPRQKYDDPYRNVVAIMMNLMLQGRQPFIYGDGRQRRCFSYIGDIRPLAEPVGFRAGIEGEIVNIGPDNEFITINELAEILANLMRFNLNPIHLPPRPTEVADANCSAEKARRLLGYETRYGLREGLAEMVEWMRAAGPRPFRYHLELEIDSPMVPETWSRRLI
jgi:UDP-glucose 4-epimerase